MNPITNPTDPKWTTTRPLIQPPAMPSCHSAACDAFWPQVDGLSFWKYMVAGSVAGMVEHMAMFPIDTLKTRMQMLTATSSPSSHSVQFAPFFASILRTEGPVDLYHDLAAMGLGAGPTHAVYFSVYETCKRKFGGAARALASAVTTPLDVVKTRLQCQGVCGADSFSTVSIRMALKQIVAKEGA